MSAAKNLIGTRLGQYKIQALLGTGSMARVFQGFDSHLQRAVAIKVLHDSVVVTPGFADRFCHEARLAAALRHPHVIQVYDVGERDGHIYIVQELLPGPTLKQRLSSLVARGAQLPSHEIVAIITQLAAALDTAHAAGVTHQNVKPSNMMWNAVGALVLTDFGIAGNMFTHASQTQTTMVSGTLGYLSPEQARGTSHLTPACDIYALGVVLFECITGTVPFHGNTLLEIMLSHTQSAPPPLRLFRPDVPPAVETVVQQALEKEPTMRFNAAGELAWALERAWPDSFATATGSILSAGNQRSTRHWPGAVLQEATDAAALPDTALPDIVTPSRASSERSRLMLLLVCLLVLCFTGTALLLRDDPHLTVTSTIPGVAINLAFTPTTESVKSVIPEPTVATLKPTLEQTSPTALLQEHIGDPLADLIRLLEHGMHDGRVGSQGDALMRNLMLAATALESGDDATAAHELNRFRSMVESGLNDGSIDDAFAQQALEGIDSITYGYSVSTVPAPAAPAPHVDTVDDIDS